MPRFLALKFRSMPKLPLCSTRLMGPGARSMMLAFRLTAELYIPMQLGPMMRMLPLRAISSIRRSISLPSGPVSPKPVETTIPVFTSFSTHCSMMGRMCLGAMAMMARSTSPGTDRISG